VTQKTLAGEVAIEVAHELTEPLRALRDRLGLVVDHIERYVATSTGPTPYPWRSLQTLRQDLAAAYLEATQLARRIEELDSALAYAEPLWFDLAAAVDHGLRLAAHHLEPGIELLIDLGNVAPAHGIPGTLALVVAQLVGVSAHSAHELQGSSLTVRVWTEEQWGVVTIADNGAGDARAIEVGDVARDILAPWGATIDAASDEGRGCAFELRLATQVDHWSTGPGQP
jgi:signal transduction histidine kinase